MKVDLTKIEVDFLLSTIDVVNIPGKLLELALDVKTKLKNYKEESKSDTLSEGTVSEIKA